eukprot:Skav201583  [mRNA]  locus=scaffold152:304313:317680:+ [translate_table: standard]
MSQVMALTQQVTSHQEEIVNLRADVEELQNVLRKATSVNDANANGNDVPGVGVSPLVKARGKLDRLCAEMADLQSRMRDAGPRDRYQDRGAAWSSAGDEVVGPGPRSAGVGGSPAR